MSENGPELTIIACENAGRGFYLHNREDSTSILQGFTITNSYHHDWGGGMYTYNSSPTVSNCMFTWNWVYIWDGGDMSNDGGNPTVTNCTFSENSATGGSGMLNINDSNPTVTNCILWGDMCNEISNYTGSYPIVTYSDVREGCEALIKITMFYHVVPIHLNPRSEMLD